MDISYLLMLQSLREKTHGIFDGFFQLVTDCGYSVLIFLLIAGVYWCIDKKTGVFMALSCGFSLLVNSILKTFATVYRPWIRDSRIHPVPSAVSGATGYSFPSGHTMGATSLYGALAYISKKGALRNVLIVLILLIGFSRNYLGVHTPQDVLVGFLGGIFVVFFIYKLLQWTESSKNADVAVLLIGFAVSVFTVIFTYVKKFPADYVNGKLLVSPLSMQADSLISAGFVIGSFLGWFLEKRFLHFTVDGTAKQKLMRFIYGAIGLILIYYPVTQIFVKFFHNVAAFFCSGFLFSMYIMYLYPLMFFKCCKKGK